MSDFFGTPIGARPQFGLLGELPGPVYRDAAGNTFQMYEQPRQEPQAPEPPRGLLDTMVRAALPMGAWRGLLSGAMEGVTAPGRAAAGEPVTYGDVWSTALDYGGVANMGAAPAGALRGGTIRAYHGSPHDFDQFDMSKIGTGEGAQTYGHGLYFAENEATARSYRDALAHKVRGVLVDGEPVHFAGDVASATPRELAALMASRSLEDGGSLFSARMRARNALLAAERGDVTAFQREAGWGDVEKLRQAQAIIEGWDGKHLERLPDGRMYEVQINADPNDFLDWDAPWDQQPSNVQVAYRHLAKQKPDGSELARRVEGPVWADEAAKRGVPGIKYLDQMSRNGGTGTRNFVVFDDKLIQILRKYGLLPAAPAAGLLASQDDDGT